MCRSIKSLYNLQPPVAEDEVRAAALQYVRKISGFARPSRANEAAFLRAVEAVSNASLELLSALETTAAPRSRAVEAKRARARSARRFGASSSQSA